MLLVDPQDAVELAADTGAVLYQLGTADRAVAAVAEQMAPLLALPHVGDRWFTSPYASHDEKQLLPQLSVDPRPVRPDGSGARAMLPPGGELCEEQSVATGGGAAGGEAAGAAVRG